VTLLSCPPVISLLFNGPFSLQGEYIHSQVARLQAKDLGFDGAYVQGSWFLTGESRPYKVKNGTFGAIDPLNDYGAWEFATRYSWIDLNSKDIKAEVFSLQTRYLAMNIFSLQ
jgi:phosphate-selective porin OprO/OprP